jgi:hypothetical protein
MNSIFTLFIICISLFGQLTGAQSSPVSEATTDQEPEITYVCQKQNDVRWVRSYLVDGNRCRSLYSKEGFVQTVGSAQNFRSCKTVTENIKANLEEGGFKCKEARLNSMIEIE